MPVNGYVSVTLKTSVIKEIKRFISTHPNQGYKSVADFITDAIRRRFEELQKREVKM